MKKIINTERNFLRQVRHKEVLIAVLELLIGSHQELETHNRSFPVGQGVNMWVGDDKGKSHGQKSTGIPNFKCDDE